MGGIQEDLFLNLSSGFTGLSFIIIWTNVHTRIGFIPRFYILQEKMGIKIMAIRTAKYLIAIKKNKIDQNVLQ